MNKNKINRKSGRIVAIDYERGMVRVEYPENGTVSPWLSVYMGRFMGTKNYSMPEINEVGIVGIYDNSHEGVYYGAPTNDEEAMPSIYGKGIHIKEYKDGTKILYDENSKKITISSVGDIDLIATGTIKLQAQKVEIISENTEMSGSLLVQKVSEFIGDLKIKGLSFTSHTHGGVLSGGASTTPPNPALNVFRTISNFFKRGE